MYNILTEWRRWEETDSTRRGGATQRGRHDRNPFRVDSYLFKSSQIRFDPFWFYRLVQHFFGECAPKKECSHSLRVGFCHQFSAAFSLPETVRRSQQVKTSTGVCIHYCYYHHGSSSLFNGWIHVYDNLLLKLIRETMSAVWFAWDLAGRGAQSRKDRSPKEDWVTRELWKVDAQSTEEQRSKRGTQKGSAWKGT